MISRSYFEGGPNARFNQLNSVIYDKAILKKDVILSEYERKKVVPAKCIYTFHGRKLVIALYLSFHYVVSFH